MTVKEIEDELRKHADKQTSINLNKDELSFIATLISNADIKGSQSMFVHLLLDKILVLLAVSE